MTTKMISVAMTERVLAAPQPATSKQPRIAAEITVFEALISCTANENPLKKAMDSRRHELCTDATTLASRISRPAAGSCQLVGCLGPGLSTALTGCNGCASLN